MARLQKLITAYCDAEEIFTELVESGRDGCPYIDDVSEVPIPDTTKTPAEFAAEGAAFCIACDAVEDTLMELRKYIAKMKEDL